MIKKVELGSVNSKNKSPKQYVSGKNIAGQTSFTGVGDLMLNGIQKCEKVPMVNVAVLDLYTDILQRKLIKKLISSKKKNKKKKDKKKRKLNLLAGFEALR